MDYDVNVITKKFEEVPLDIREAMSSIKMSEAIEEMGKKYGILFDKLDELYDEIGSVMLGLNHPRDFVVQIERKLGVSSGKATLIAKDVDEQIFKPINQSLRKIHQISREGGLINIPTTPIKDAPNAELSPMSGIPQASTPQKLTIPDSNFPRSEEILHGIENPVPTQSREKFGVIKPDLILEKEPLPPEIIVVKKIEPFVKPTNSPTLAPQSTTTTSPTEKNFLEEKLSSTVRMPKEEVVIEKSVVPPSGGMRKTDPYREPLE